MPFTAQELQNIAAAQLSFYMKGPAMAQSIQARPLYDAMQKKKKTFSGGDGFIRKNVKGDYTTRLRGYEHDDVVGYDNPANIKQSRFAWKQLHGGIQLTFDELKRDGITIVDSTVPGKSQSQHSDREIHTITSLLQDKLDDMGEGIARDFNTYCWQDGTSDPKVFAGLKAFITDTPTSGIVGGLDRGSLTWWRNRSLVGASKITSSTSLQTLTKTLRKEVRQLRRYGGKPSLLLCGSTFLERLEAEVFEKGYYSQTGFTNNGKNDIGMASITMQGVGDFIYDPTMDDNGEADRCYFIDTSKLHLMVMEGEDFKEHNPARPHDRYVIYRAVTWTGALIVTQMNCHGVYQVA
jgi:hypothetical protein